MRIVHVLPALIKGGAERVAVDLANAAVEAGHEATLVLAHPADPALLQDRLDPRVETRFVRPRAGRLESYLALIPWIRRNRAWLRERDIIHCHLTYGGVAGTLIKALLRRSAPPIVETYHAVGMAIPRWKRWVHGRLLEGRDAVALMAEDAFWTRWAARNPEKMVRLIPNGVSANPAPAARDVDAYRKQVGLPRDAVVVGSVGRLLHERRPDRLLEAYAQAAKDLPPNVHLLLGGDGPERSALARRAAELGLGERVHLPGLVTDASRAFALIDLYLTINVGPTTGIAAIEAAMSGVPVIAVQLDSTYRSTSGDWISSSADLGEVGRKAAELLADRAQLGRVAERQREYAARNLSGERMARDYERFYAAAYERSEERK